MWFSKSHFQSERKTALIIGASQGVGASLALKLYKEKCNVILVARTESKLIPQVEKIKREVGEGPQNATYITCDVSDYTQCCNMWNELINVREKDPDFIFCCAGSATPKLFNDLTEDELSSGISTNYNTAVYVVHTGFKKILEKYSLVKASHFKKRHIIFFSSVVSFFPFIGYGQYAPMKAAIESLSIILRQELGPYNYRVSCVFPGNFQSEGYEEEQRTKPEITKKIEGSSHPISADDCACLIIDKLSKGYDTITTDFIGWFLGCSVLGVLPREWSFFQVFVGLLFLIIYPIVNYSISHDISSYFKSRDKEEEEFELIDKKDS
ncbi:uncharacterized protein PRCAT00002078001 [Priceomyces carsonii]|uniref:uncharacterized protein n=1 Tax=Priceomyces carsonii TaxID=28549 RepID=UPI002ED79AE9|nr:unnamed protein product [Priceomyces carsonii]